jgi:hypothetical protein
MSLTALLPLEQLDPGGKNGRKAGIANVRGGILGSLGQTLGLSYWKNGSMATPQDKAKLK